LSAGGFTRYNTEMIDRKLSEHIVNRLAFFPAVALLGPRQCGKTTLAAMIASQHGDPVVMLDLERADDLALLADAPLFLRQQRGKLVVIDEVQRSPEVFRALRVEIDARRRAGETSGHFLLLGSASRDLLRQASESLAGRIDFIELAPLRLDEVAENSEPEIHRLWHRGGFPDSFLAPDDALSLAWRKAYLAQVIERDVPFFAPRVPGPVLRRLLTMLAFEQGSLLNASRYAQSLGISGQSVNRYLQLLIELLHVRSLEPWHGQSSRRLNKSPKVYVRDSGLLHALLDLVDEDALIRHPVVGPSFEGFVIEQIISILGPEWTYSHFRTQHGAEIDLVCERRDRRLAIEVKRSSNPVPSRGFCGGCEAVQATDQWLVHAGEREAELGGGLQSFPWTKLVNHLSAF
jgi:uncharacterized protein